jgi:hypothetical protein
MELKLSQALAVLQYLDEHPSEFSDEDRARIKRIFADVPFANLMHEARMEAQGRKNSPRLIAHEQPSELSLKPAQ